MSIIEMLERNLEKREKSESQKIREISKELLEIKKAKNTTWKSIYQALIETGEINITYRTFHKYVTRDDSKKKFTKRTPVKKASSPKREERVFDPSASDIDEYI